METDSSKKEEPVAPAQAASEGAPATATPEAATKKPRKPRAPRKKKEADPDAKEEKADVQENKENVKPAKKLSKIARKRSDERYFLNGKGRLVSRKKSENGKRNVQSRAVRLARDALGLTGRMVLLGKGVEGRALVKLTRTMRDCLKDGKTDDEAKTLYAALASELLEKEKEAEGA